MSNPLTTAKRLASSTLVAAAVATAGIGVHLAQAATTSSVSLAAAGNRSTTGDGSRETSRTTGSTESGATSSTANGSTSAGVSGSGQPAQTTTQGS